MEKKQRHKKPSKYCFLNFNFIMSAFFTFSAPGMLSSLPLTFDVLLSRFKQDGWYVNNQILPRFHSDTVSVNSVFRGCKQTWKLKAHFLFLYSFNLFHDCTYQVAKAFARIFKLFEFWVRGLLPKNLLGISMSSLEEERISVITLQNL